MDFGIAGVAAITVICYLIGMLAKASSLDDKWIPVTCGFFGAGLGLAGLYIGMVDFPATDPLNAIAIGVVSGLAATGLNQAVKQLSR